ncbi:hypothetical protein EP073_02495 [Geovibrio thiophilus]|uniref:Uncharacterized protein n=1 Tax=Geovibrio thiophilus TaxID=139438 RepID=A0A410JWA8_9BACT|nr:hypothetical protein [Geovibrio thiophilus]QAR32305.1 hypothetical protein EP073_02495 [Geovibrio thiophilus]
MKVERSNAVEQQVSRNSSDEVVKYSNSAIAETVSRIEDKRLMRIAEYDTIEYHKELRVKDFNKMEKTKTLRLAEYGEIMEERAEVKQLLVKLEEKQEQRLTKEYRDQQYLTELFMKGLHFDALV